MKSQISIYTTLVICSFLPFASQNIINNNIDENLLENIASELLKNGEANNMLQNLLKSEGGQQLGGMVMENLLKTGDGGSNDIVSGLGNMLTDDKGNLDTKMLGNMLQMFTENETIQKPSRKSTESAGLPTLSGLIKDITGDFLNGANGVSLLSYLPMLMQTVTSYTKEDAQHHADDHSSHAWLIPPVLEKLHVLWDHFTHSDLGRSLYQTLRVEKILKNFSDQNGNFNFDRLVELMENHSFRRYWIKKATGTLADLIGYFADPAIQKKYFVNVMFLANGFLKARGYPKQVLFDTNRPTESISSFLNYMTKKYFSFKMDFTPYVKPIVGWVVSLIHMAQEQSRALKSGITTHSVADKITDILNLELIEPVLRVFRAYRYAKRVPKCDKYVMCLINQEEQNKDIGLSSVRLALSKMSSLFAGWFLSYHTESSYWSLYRAITHDTNTCTAAYPEDCSDFHAEEMKVTTEYYHNEL